VTYALLTNHIHLLLEVDPWAEVSESEVISRLKVFYDRDWVAGFAERVRLLREAGNVEGADALLDGYRYRMNDLSEAMKTLMQRFTQDYNRRHKRHGTLWEGRFKSVLVEGRGEALAMIAAYIDLNPVRAGIVDDPKDYRYCGYGEAVAGSSRAQQGLQLVLGSLGRQPSGWDPEAYRTFVFAQGATHPKGATRSEHFLEHAEKVLAEGGRLGRAELLHCRVRYFCDGVVLGSASFVQERFVAYRDQFGLKRRSGPRPIRYANLPGLCTMRDLRRTPIQVPRLT
jgi:REP element-mobilizing transposase RayT